MKTKKLFSKVLAAALAVLMLVGMLPVFASAAEERAADDTGVEGLYLNKTATLENDGTYTINLEAFSTGESLTVMKQTPTDIVLVLDVSGSMDDDFVYTSGKAWTSVKDKVTSMPSDAHHLCPDGTYSEVDWTKEGPIKTTYRYTCKACKATRKWSNPIWQTIPGEGDNDSWNLWRYTDEIKTKQKMLALQEAVKAFINGVAAKNAGITDTDQQHRVAIVKFASETTMDTIGNDTYKDGSYTYNYTQTVAGLTTVTSEAVAALNGKVDALKPGGATAADKGMQMASGILANSGDRDTAVILFTDGEPTYSNEFESNVANSAVSAAKAMKDNGTVVYSVGLFDGADPADTSNDSNAYLNAVSSNYPNATAYTSLGERKKDGYYKICSQAGNLTDIFREIESSIGTTTVDLDTNAELRDIFNNGFTLTDASEVTVQTDAYSGRDRNGNRVFANNPQPLSTANVQKNVQDNTVTVSGFDYSTKYLLDGDKLDNEDFRAAAGGEKLIVTITSVEATDPAVTDALISTNSPASGIYEKSGSTIPYALFPQPKTQLSSKAYVLDYAKKAIITDMPSTTQHMDAYGMHKFSEPNTELNMTYGSAGVDSYTPKTMLWDGYDTYYVFGRWNTQPEGVTTGDNTWTKVSVLPANNVYYEDTFISSEETDDAPGTVGITYTGTWDVQTEGSNSENVKDGIQGWVEDLSNDTGDSDGTVAMAYDKTATATFKFTGTGFDVYSRTNMTSGKVYAKVSWTDENGAPHNKGLFVDTESASGEYYSIPTLWFSGEDYGEYTVTIMVQSDAVDGEYSYCIDGIRIYNPLAPEKVNEDETVQEAYGEELNAYFETVREMLLEAGSFAGTSEDSDAQSVDGVVFIDKVSDTVIGTTTNDIGTYTDYGPKNEVYLAPGNAIAFYVGDVAKLQVGLKAPEEGGNVTVNASNGENVWTKQVNHTTDLYYEVVPDANGFVVIRNASNADDANTLLSVTKVKFLLQDDGVAETDTASLLMAVEEFDAKPVVAYSLRAPEPAEPETPAETETPTETETPAESETPTEPQAPDIVIDNPEPQPQPDNEAKPDRSEINARIEETLKKLFSSFRGWF